MSDAPHPTQNRRGDAEILSLQRPGIAGHVEIYAHDDGGVTICCFDRHGAETDRASFMREDWQEIVAFVEGPSCRI